MLDISADKVGETVFFFFFFQEKGYGIIGDGVKVGEATSSVRWWSLESAAGEVWGTSPAHRTGQGAGGTARGSLPTGGWRVGFQTYKESALRCWACPQ